MRASRLSIPAIVVMAIAACGSPPATPTTGPASSAGTSTAAGSPSALPPGAGTPNPTGQAGAPEPWTYPTGEIRGLGFAADGTAYVFSWHGDNPSQLVALDSAGSVRPGWPQEVADPGIGGGPIEAPGGDILVLTLSYDNDGVIAYALRRYGPDGAARDGWPYVFDRGAECSGPAIDASGNAVVACGTEAGSRVVAIDPSGDPAWDTPLPSFRSGTRLERAIDGTLYLASAMGDGLIALGADGEPLQGWPVRASGGVDMLATPAGLLAWWHEGADEDVCHNGGQTVYTVLGADGAPLTGWPQSIPGYASAPAVGRDGSIVVVDPDQHAIAFAADGGLRDGWPAAVAGVTGSCFGPPTPSVASDGTVFVATGGQAPDGAISAIGPDGVPLDGWPLDPNVEFAYPCRDCTPGPQEPDPAVTHGDLTYIAMYREGGAGTDVLALDRSGGVAAGWPAHVAADQVTLQLAPDGRLFAILLNSEDPRTSTLAFLLGGG